MRSPLEDLREEIALAAANNRMLRAQLAAVEQERDAARAALSTLRTAARAFLYRESTWDEVREQEAALRALVPDTDPTPETKP